MQYSFAEHPEFTCPECKGMFNPELWLLVNVDERPDLVESIRTGNLHNVECPHCGQTIAIDAPLLLFSRGSNPPVLFSPAQSATRETSIEQALYLVDLLRRRLGVDWRDAWLKEHGLPAVALRQALPGLFNFDVARSPELLAIRQELYNPELSDDLPRRIQLARKGLGLISREQDPELWASFHGTLGNCLSKVSEGNQAENLEQAIHHCHLSQEVYSRHDFPEYWASVQLILAKAYLDRRRGDPAENIERAIELINDALSVYQRDILPLQWAHAQGYLGRAYSGRILGDPAENIEKTIYHFQQSFEIDIDKNKGSYSSILEHDTPINHVLLAHAYMNRRNGLADNIDSAIAHFQLAQQYYKRLDAPETWWMWYSIQNNLAYCYRNRLHGDYIDNIEKAIECGHQALEVFTQHGFSDLQAKVWAKNHHNLGSAYRQRIKDERANNLERAIYHYHQALTVFNRETSPIDWARVQNDLANAYGTVAKPQ